MIACENSGHDIFCDFADVSKIVEERSDCVKLGWLEVDKSWEYSKMKGAAMFRRCSTFSCVEGGVEG